MDEVYIFGYSIICMNLSSKTFGLFITIFAIILLVVLGFVKADIDNQAAFLCENFHENGWDMSTCPAHKSNVSWLLSLSFGLSFLMTGAGIFLWFQRPATTPKDFRNIDLDKLDAAEKIIYNLAKSKGGSVYQSDIVKETSMSKVKVTRILDKMETGDVIERKRRGMTNLIVLK